MLGTAQFSGDNHLCVGEFKGFPKDFCQFFKEVAKNNERPWLEENKERHKASVVAPMSNFITAISPQVAIRARRCAW
jgi:uncharacterized protein (DUF2461 family)